MSDLITRRLLVIAAVWATLVLIGTPPAGATLIGTVAGVAGTFTGAVLAACAVKLLVRKVRGGAASGDPA